VIVGAARKTNRQALADGRVRAVTAGDVGSLTDIHGAIAVPDARAHTVGHLFERYEFRLTLDIHAGFGETIDQQAFMLVLRVDQRIGKRAQILAHLPEDHMRSLVAQLPQIDGGHLPATAHDRVGQSDLAIQFERASLHGEGT
jgi:hypothetical protein